MVGVPVQLEPVKNWYVTVPLAVRRSVPVRVAESVTESPAVIVEAESVVEMVGLALITVTV
jgi:hypothetical protein